MPRQRRPLLALVAAALALAVGAFFAGGKFVSPTQQAAAARPPRFAAVTAPIVFGSLASSVVFRATAVEPDAVSVPPVADLGGARPVVTSENVKIGQLVTTGTLLMSVAEHPVILLDGVIPAFRTIGFGDSGVDVSEIQASLRSLGFGVDDPEGVYGISTANAVGDLYRRLGFQPALSEVRLPSSGGGSKHNHPVQLPIVPLGEVALVPLPMTVERVSVRAGALATKDLATLTSGAVELTGSVPYGSSITRGEPGVAMPDASGKRIAVEVVRVSQEVSTSSGSSPTSTVTLRTHGATAQGLVGQNLRVVVSPRDDRRGWLVPLSAVSTRANGLTYITVVARNRAERVVRVAVGATADGRQVVKPIRTRLHGGEQVVIGMTQG